MSKRKLRKDLRKTGATPSEASQLADVAKLLGGIKTRGLDSEAKKRLAPNPEVTKRSHTWQFAVAGTFAMACLLLFVAQSALPGSWLYGIKRGTENARGLVQPGYKENLVEEREDEVQQLKLKKADPAVLEEAKKNYQKAVEKTDEKEYKPRYDWSRQWFRNRSFRSDDDSNKVRDRLDVNWR